MLALAADHVDRRVVQRLGVGLLVDALAVDAAAVELDEVVRPRQAAGVARLDRVRHASSAQATESRRDASSAPWARASSFAQAICGCTRPPRPQSVAAMTRSAADRVGEALDAVGDELAGARARSSRGRRRRGRGPRRRAAPRPSRSATRARGGRWRPRRSTSPASICTSMSTRSAIPMSVECGPCQLPQQQWKRTSSRGMPAQRVVERLDADHRELPVVLQRRLGRELVPVLREGRLVDLDDDARVRDREVLLAHRLRARPDELLLGGVVRVADP